MVLTLLLWDVIDAYMLVGLLFIWADLAWALRRHRADPSCIQIRFRDFDCGNTQMPYEVIVFPGSSELMPKLRSHVWIQTSSAMPRATNSATSDVPKCFVSIISHTEGHAKFNVACDWLLFHLTTYPCSVLFSIPTIRSDSGDHGLF
jgi:hypothetical protein